MRRCEACGSERVVASLLFRCPACGRLCCARCRARGLLKCRDCAAPGEGLAGRIRALLRDQRGQAEALLAVGMIVVLAVLTAGYIALAGAVRARDGLREAALAAARAAAAQLDPAALLQGQAAPDPARARQAFQQAFPSLAGLNPDWTPAQPGVVSGRVRLDAFGAYSAQDAGRQDCGGQPVAGPGVCARLSAPGRVTLPGGVPYDFTIAVTVRAAAPSYGKGAGWRYQ